MLRTCAGHAKLRHTGCMLSMHEGVLRAQLVHRALGLRGAHALCWHGATQTGHVQGMCMAWL